MPTKKTTYIHSGVEINVMRKKMKTLRLTVKNNSAYVSVPLRTPNKIIENFVSKNILWIKKSIVIEERKNQSLVDSLEHGSTLKVWGDNVVLNISMSLGKTKKWRSERDELILCDVKNNNTDEKTHSIESFYRNELTQVIPNRLKYWEGVIGVSITHWSIRKMKTRWGSCNIQRRRISLNLDLARWPRECLDYVIVHELVHLYEASHNARFWRLVESFMPDWKRSHRMLNESGS